MTRHQVADPDWPTPRPEGQYLSPNCRVAMLPGTADDWPDGHPKCEAPGYQHPILGWMPVPCTCTCHPKGATL